MKRVFNKGIVVPFFTLFGIVAIFDWIVFPGLTKADTLANLISVVVGFFTLVFGYFGLGIDKFVKRLVLYDEDEIVSQQTKDELQIKAGIKGDYQKSTITPDGAKIIAELWKSVETEDAFSDVPFGRLSNEAKAKMVEIAKDDLRNQIQNAELHFEKLKNINVTKTK